LHDATLFNLKEGYDKRKEIPDFHFEFVGYKGSKSNPPTRRNSFIFSFSFYILLKKRKETNPNFVRKEKSNDSFSWVNLIEKPVCAAV
jgi:hypothetical protein